MLKRSQRFAVFSVSHPRDDPILSHLPCLGSVPDEILFIKKGGGERAARRASVVRRNDESAASVQRANGGRQRLGLFFI